ncbi:hypothetical protein ACFQ8W_00335 [Streptomyces sp. NPDC056508]|uniref:hypothetical protein n=1 Tax=Streptomyces sp. NPDC056508 TaxID=3345845 RepID=UPI0036C35ADD
MAKILTPSKVTVELSRDELDLIQHALNLVADFGDYHRKNEADQLRIDLTEV